jgi:hypothetical protein
MMRFYSRIPALAFLVLAGCGDGSNGGGGATPNGNTPPSDQFAQRRAAGADERAPSGATSARGEVPLRIELSAGGDRAELTGMGRCTHAPQASIYGVPAALWRIQDSDAGEIRHATLTVWRPASGNAGDQFSLAISSRAREYRISTVKGGEIVGSGSITMHPSGAGARFEIVGTDADGRSVRATFQCERFAEHVAEGG